MTDEKKRLARKLLEIGAVQFCMECSGAQASPIVFNLRTPDNSRPGPLTPETVAEVAKMFKAIIDKEGDFAEFLVGVSSDVDPFVKELLKLFPDKGEEAVLYLAEESKESTRRVGPLTEESKKRVTQGGWTVLTDGLIVLGESKLEAIYELEDSGLLVSDVIVLIDHELKGKENIEDAGYTLSSVFVLSDLLKFYLLEGLISREKYEKVCSYIRENN